MLFNDTTVKSRLTVGTVILSLLKTVYGILTNKQGIITVIRNDQNNNEETGFAKLFYEGKDSRFTSNYANLPIRQYIRIQRILFKCVVAQSVYKIYSVFLYTVSQEGLQAQTSLAVPHSDDKKVPQCTYGENIYQRSTGETLKE